MTWKVIALTTTLLTLHPSLFASNLQSSNAKPETCIGCHGPNGNSPHPESPSLASQQTEYFTTQIKAFREGKRVSPIMQIITRHINDSDAEKLANHFAVLPPRPTLPQTMAPLDSKMYSACVECHGTSGEGTGFNPSIAGQQPEYTYRQLLQYKSGIRVHPEIEALLGSLSDLELKALSDYLAILR